MTQQHHPITGHKKGSMAAIMCSDGCPRCKAMLPEESQMVETRAETRAKRQPPPETNGEKTIRIIAKKRKRDVRQAAKEARDCMKQGKIKSLQSYFSSKKP
jgi:hypothetical protein